MKINGNKIKISIILPIYENTTIFEKCLDSLLNQTLTNLEIVCIDYSSNYYLNQKYGDKPIKLISQSYSKNILNSIEGEYIYLANPNDFFTLAAFDLLYDYASSKNLDLLLFPSFSLNNDEIINNDSFKVFNDYNKSKFSYKDMINDLFSISHDVTNVLYKKSYLMNLGIEFPTSFSFYNILFFFKTILSTLNIGFFNNAVLFKNNFNDNNIIGDNLFVDFNLDRCKYIFINCYDVSHLNKDDIFVLKDLLELFKEFNLFKIFSRDLINYIVYFMKKIYLQSHDRRQVFESIKLFLTDFNNSDMHVTFILSADVKNLFFYRTVLSSDSYRDFELNYEIENLKIDKEKEFFKTACLMRNINELNLELDNLKRINNDLKNKISVLNQNHNKDNDYKGNLMLNSDFNVSKYQNVKLDNWSLKNFRISKDKQRYLNLKNKNSNSY